MSYQRQINNNGVGVTITHKPNVPNTYPIPNMANIKSIPNGMKYGSFMNEEEQTLKEIYNSLEPSDRRYRHAHSYYIYELIKSCGTTDDTTHDNFKYNFKKKYSGKHKLYSFKHDVYENAIELFGKIETLDDNLKRKLASAIQIMADYHKNKNTKNELERFANQYHWAFKRSFGGTRKTLRKKQKTQKKTLRKK